MAKITLKNMLEGLEIEENTEVSITKKLDEGFWKESPVEEEEIKKFFSYEDKYISEIIDDVKQDGFKTIKKGKISIDLINRRNAIVSFNRDADLRNPATGDVKKGVSVRMKLLAKNDRYKKQLRGVIDFLTEDEKK